MPRRKGFNINTWKPSCKCKHTHVEHTPLRPHKCTTCGCGGFVGDFVCLSCDRRYEEHMTVYELEMERKADKKPIRDAYMPLASTPEI
jgi:hypothetical protein